MVELEDLAEYARWQEEQDSIPEPPEEIYWRHEMGDRESFPCLADE